MTPTYRVVTTLRVPAVSPYMAELHNARKAGLKVVGTGGALVPFPHVTSLLNGDGNTADIVRTVDPDDDGLTNARIDLAIDAIGTADPDGLVARLTHRTR